ncbi:hypothetical protein ACRRS0_00575 [Agarivorans sp. QJM3NY_29]|uniref:hypothetical protein n=1 Tax=unclassified Agarivorans TaxID=2636026 RepID=UPI003D7E0405
MKISSKVKNLILFIPAALILSMFIVYGIGDFWVIGVVAEPAEIARFNFGAEAMIAHGGDKYRSSFTYALASLVIGLIGILGFVGSLYILSKAKSNPIGKAYLTSASVVLLIFFIGQVW